MSSSGTRMRLPRPGSAVRPTEAYAARIEFMRNRDFSSSSKTTKIGGTGKEKFNDQKHQAPQEIPRGPVACRPRHGPDPLVTTAAKAATPVASAPADGVIKQKSDYAFDETVTRIKADIATKGIRFFDEIDQTALGASADLPINPSKLLLFGNPPLGVQFLQANPVAGLDWPVRMLVTQDDDGTVWVSWSDFRFIANRYQLADRDKQIAMASEVAASIASSTRK